MNRLRLFPATLATLATLACPGAMAGEMYEAHELAEAHAGETATRPYNAHWQATYVTQYKPAFAAAYQGPHSLGNAAERGYSFTSTLALGLRLWPGGAFYVNPEVAQGVALGQLSGLGGLSNGEAARSSGPQLSLYQARMFLRQTWSLGGEASPLPSSANQLPVVSGDPGTTRRLVLSVGNMSVLDLFDDNAYSHDPRTQFLNWSLMTHGAYDYAADARGYSRGVALEWVHDDWALRGGRFLQPREPNQQQLDSHFMRHYGDQLELEHGHRLFGAAGRLRLLAFRNRATMARYEDALALARQSGHPPDLAAVRGQRQQKSGLGLNLEQALTDSLGVFARVSRADGRSETYAFTEIDRSFSAGLQWRGAAWGRAADQLGLAWAVNQLSPGHRAYLAAGGLGFFLGDGQLNYRPERISEAYYAFNLTPGSWLTLDAQRLRHPGYNADRGPVQVWSVRFHLRY